MPDAETFDQPLIGKVAAYLLPEGFVITENEFPCRVGNFPRAFGKFTLKLASRPAG